MERCAESNYRPHGTQREDTQAGPEPVFTTPRTSTNEYGGKRTSIFWEHFEILPGPLPKDQKAKCKYCNTVLKSSANNGTSSLKNHLLSCKLYPANVDKKQKILSFQVSEKWSECGSTHSLTSWTFNQEKCRKSLTRMIIIDELPFRHVEHEGFRNFCNDMQPQFVIPSRMTVARDCLSLFQEEKMKLKKSISKLKRVSLTTDTWTSNQNLSYMCLTAHFIDDDWKLHKKIINFCPIPGHSGEIIGKAIENCLIDWGITKVLTVTVDNASSNDVGMMYLKRRLNNWEGSVLNSEMLHMRCAAHILNLVVKDGLAEVADSVYRIRSAVKYVRSSPSRLQKFKGCIEKERIKSNSLVCLDVDTRWNSTYLMLENAVKFQKAFDLLELEDTKYRQELLPKDGELHNNSKKGLPSLNDWDYARSLIPFLKIFYDTTLNLSGSLYVSCNEFIKKIYGIGIILKRKCGGGSSGNMLMASRMKKKFDKYWGNINNINYLLFIATILDPRCKIGYVNFIIREVYEKEKADELITKVQSTLERMFDFYSTNSPSPNLHKSVVDLESVVEEDDVVNVEDIIQSLYKRQKFDLGVLENKSELEKYLEEGTEGDGDKNFDVLEWWKSNSSKYKVLSSIAREVLAIPVSTVSSESAFSTGGRVLDSFRSSLTPRMVEALICGQDWLRRSHEPIYIEESLIELESMESESCVSDEHIVMNIDDD